MSIQKRKHDYECNGKNCLNHQFCKLQRFEQEYPTILLNDLNKPKGQQQHLKSASQYQYDASRVIKTDQAYQTLNIDGVTEEELDDWIAQNANRPIQSYLDPYKKFSAPASLLSQIKRRYRQNVKKNDPSLKKLYFPTQDEKPYSRLDQITNNSYIKGITSTNKKKQVDLTFNYLNVSPTKQQVASIRERERKLSKYGSPNYLNTSPNQRSDSPDYRNISPNYKNNLKHNSHEDSQIQHNNSFSYTNNNNQNINAQYLQRSEPRQKSTQKQYTQNNIDSYGNNYEYAKIYNPKMQSYSNNQVGYDPDKDINFNSYNRKQIEVIKDLQQRYSRNESPNLANNYSIRSNSNNQKQYNINFIPTKQRGSSAFDISRQLMYNQFESPQKLSHNNTRPPSVIKQQINKTYDIVDKPKYYDKIEEKSNKDIQNRNGESFKRGETSPYNQIDKKRSNSSAPSPNPFTQGKEQFRNSYLKISGQKNVDFPFPINISQLPRNQKTDINPFNPQNFQIENSLPLNSPASNQIGNGQPSKIPSYRQNQNKKNIKEEVLDKELLKKIIEKVEKLLSEKEEKLIGENDPKGQLNDRFNEKQPQERPEDQNTPELNYNQHLNELIDVGKSKNQQDSADASFLKGVGRMKKDKDRGAVTAFKQALNFDKAHFYTIYNLASIYEKNKRFKCAESWLEIANMFKKNKNDISYGYAIIYYKQYRYEDAYKKIDALIEELSKYLEEEESIPQTHLYLRSLCAKKLGQQKSQDNQQDDKQQKQIDEKVSSSPIKENGKQKDHSQKNRESKSVEKQKRDERKQSQEEEAKMQKKEQLLIMPSSSQYYKKASEDYTAFIKYTCPKNFMLLKDFMFAIVFKKIRKMEIKFPPHIFCEFFSLINQILAADTYEPVLEPLVKHEQHQILNGWVPPIMVGKVPVGFEKDRRTNQYPPLIQPGVGLNLSLLERRKQEIVNKLSDLSFFKRYSVQTIQNFLPKFELRYIDKSDLLFAQKGEVYIIIGGHLTVFDHSKQFNEPDIVTYYSQGDIIGCDDKDNKISFHPDIWILSLTRVEYVAIPESDFIELWNIQNDSSHKQILNFIRQIDIFDKVSQLTLYRLAFELFKEKIFQNNDIVFNDGEFVHKYNYIELHQEDPKALKNLKNRIFNKIDILPLTQQAIQGFFIVQEGNLELKTFGNWQNYILRPYNFIGENLLFPTLSISRFGQIVCSSPTTKCLFLSRYDFHKISSLDKEVMKANVQKSDYYSNCQKILNKYYKHHKIDDYDQQSIINNTGISNNNN